MPIFRAIGFGVFLVMLRLLIPSVLDEGEQTAISFLRGARISADTASRIAASAELPVEGEPRQPLFLPQTPQIPQ